METHEFTALIWNYYREHGRIFAWRESRDPYEILVSEIMLQQTQTLRVLPKYETFIRQFPTMKSLADATTADVLAAWSGLGYNRRGVYLHRLAKVLLEKYDGEIPKDPEVLVTLPGLGKATAASVLVFAFNMPLVFIETNIRRVFLHFFFSDEHGVPDREITDWVEKTLDRDNPREWYWALMDYGAHLAKTGTNANYRSHHFKKQSPFATSVRKARGEIMKLLVREGGAAYATLEERIIAEPEKIEKAVEGLIREGLIKIEKGFLLIA